MVFNFEKYKNNIAAILDDGRELTYDELNQESDSLKLLLKPRTLIFCMCSNTIGTVIGYVTCFNNGVVPLMLDENIDTEFLDILISEYKPDYVWVADKKIESLHLLKYTNLYSVYGYSLIKTQYNNEYKLNDQLALLLTTSGSTGSNKLVRLSYQNIMCTIMDIKDAFDIKENDVYLAMLPFNYAFGLTWSLTHLYTGAKMIITQKTVFDDQLWNYIKTKATVLTGVPYTYELMDRMNVYEKNIGSIRSMTVAGSKLNDELRIKYSNYLYADGRQFINMYGLTEGTTMLLYNSEYGSNNSLGIACNSGCVYLEDESGVVITSNNTEGELIYKGKNVALGYAECGDDLKKDDEFHGILRTGDIAKRDDHGLYYVVGRKKRFIKLFGIRVSLDETEQIVRNNFNNFECACSGTDDKMVIFITDESKINEVRQFIHKKLNISKSALTVRYIKFIPRNSTGKIKYASIV